tara:strand:+ start:511 stop:1572 length:1062 start_codon:yes stop_codon:yes gene_type:complete
MAYTTIDDPSLYHQTVTYTGNGSSQSINFDGNSDMQPDMLWTKSRGDNSDPIIRDSQRGIGNRLLVHATDGEGGATGTTAFNSDGFSLDSTGTVNANSQTFVAWGWKANGGTETNSQSESGSQIACSVQANTTAGFSIITYTGTGGTGHTFLHGLGSTPAWFIIKRRSGTEDWLVYHHKNTSDPATDYLLLNTTDATVDSATRFDDTSPNSTEIACGNNAVINGDGSTYVCWAWKEVQGFSKFGSYTGNGNADGAFVYTGFKPAWIILKRSSSTGNWLMYDNKRDIDNEALSYLVANTNDAESTAANGIDLLSNGFKIRRTGVSWNNSGDSYIYMAFAEHPFVSSKGVPVTAR